MPFVSGGKRDSRSFEQYKSPSRDFVARARPFATRFTSLRDAFRLASLADPKRGRLGASLRLPVIQPLSAAFAADFIAFTLLNTREMKLFGVSSLLRCAFFQIRLGIPGIIACSTFASILFLLFGGNILC